MMMAQHLNHICPGAGLLNANKVYCENCAPQAGWGTIEVKDILNILGNIENIFTIL